MSSASSFGGDVLAFGRIEFRDELGSEVPDGYKKFRVVGYGQDDVVLPVRRERLVVATSDDVAAEAVYESDEGIVPLASVEYVRGERVTMLEIFKHKVDGFDPDDWAGGDLD